MRMEKRTARKTVTDKIVKGIFLAITLICASIIVFIVFFICLKGMTPFFKKYTIDGQGYRVSFFKFIFGTTWNSAPNVYSVGFIIINTLYVVILATLIAVPISVLTALFVAKIAPKKIGSIISSAVELLASIPSIIYGLFGVGVITALVKNVANVFGYQTYGGISTISTVLVLAIMIMPTITMISITSIKAVKQEQVNGSLALGASMTQTNFKIVLRGAKSGIFSGIILGVGRAIGEATAISMVAGNKFTGPTLNLFDITRTLTSTMMTGFGESQGLGYDIRFSVGVVLIAVIICTNIGLNFVKRRLFK